MDKAILIILIIVIILTALMYVLLRRIVDMINKHSKLYFIAKLQSYDKLIEEKQKQLEELKLETKDNNTSESVSTVRNVNTGLVVADIEPEFKVDGLSDLLKQIESDFNYNYRKIVEAFVKISQKNKNYRYDELNLINDSVSKYGLFNIVTANKEKQNNIIEELNINKTNFYKDYMSTRDNIDFNEFMKLVKSGIEESDPKVYVYVGNKNESYDDMADNVSTIVDSSILKGIKIKYHGNIYDYSIN